MCRFYCKPVELDYNLRFLWLNEHLQTHMYVCFKVSVMTKTL